MDHRAEDSGDHSKWKLLSWLLDLGTCYRDAVFLRPDSPASYHIEPFPLSSLQRPRLSLPATLRLRSAAEPFLRVETSGATLRSYICTWP